MLIFFYINIIIYTMKNEINDVIKTLTEKRNISMRELARQLGMLPQGLSQKLHKTDSTKIEFLKQIAEATDCYIEINFIDKNTGEIIA